MEASGETGYVTGTQDKRGGLVGEAEEITASS